LIASGEEAKATKIADPDLAIPDSGDHDRSGNDQGTFVPLLGSSTWPWQSRVVASRSLRLNRRVVRSDKILDSAVQHYRWQWWR
jgi:hypothetical protein